MIEIIEPIVDDLDFYEFTIDKLKDTDGWHIAADHWLTDGRYSPLTEKDKSDTGLLFETFRESWDRIEYEHHKHINSTAEFFLKKYFNKSKYIFNNVNINRFMFNYYNRSSTGVIHQDMLEPGWQSVLINLNSNDGGTIVNDKFYSGALGKAISFPSESFHRGVGPTVSPNRFCLNIIFSYDDIELKT